MQQRATYEALGWTFGDNDAAPWVMPDNSAYRPYDPGYPIL
ncbi:hypothetical protein [Cupriavidus necator]